MSRKPRNVAGSIVRGPDLWGRNTEVAELWDRLGRAHVLLAGPRRHGKSSVMWALRDAPQDGWEVLFLEVEYIERPADFLTELAAEALQLEPVRRWMQKASALPATLGRWLSGIELAAPIPDVGELKLRLRDQQPEDVDWHTLGEQLLSRLGARTGRLLIIVDEFPMMVGNMLDNDPDEGLDFLKWFRAQRQRLADEGPRFLLGGSLDIEARLRGLAREALINDLDVYTLRPLEPDAATRFVTEVFEGEDARFEPGVPAEIVRVCGSGVHFYLHLIVQECRAAMRESGEPIGVADVSRVYETVVGPQGKSRFSHAFSRIRERYGDHEHLAKRVLADLCLADAMTRKELAHAARRRSVEPRRLDDVLVQLEADFYVLCDGDEVRFADGVLKDWWRRNAPGVRRSK